MYIRRIVSVVVLCRSCGCIPIDVFLLRRDIIVHAEKDKGNDGPASSVSNFWTGVP